MLKAALKANSADATAHYLLGTFYFSRGLADAALSEWAEARRFNPQIPVLDASTGLALLRFKNDPERALAAFRVGLRIDTTHVSGNIGHALRLILFSCPP